MTLIVYSTNSSTMIVYQNENQAWHSGNTIYSKIRCKQNVVKQRGKLSIDSKPYFLLVVPPKVTFCFQISPTIISWK